MTATVGPGPGNAEARGFSRSRDDAVRPSPRARAAARAAGHADPGQIEWDRRPRPAGLEGEVLVPAKGAISPSGLSSGYIDGADVPVAGSAIMIANVVAVVVVIALIVLAVALN